jgi:hypothetical protein
MYLHPAPTMEEQRKLTARAAEARIAIARLTQNPSQRHQNYFKGGLGPLQQGLASLFKMNRSRKSM